jgi:nickel-dependent lactate racemase
LEFWIPYGTTEVPLAVADENLLGFLSITEDSTERLPRNAMTPPLSEMALDSTLLEAARHAKKTVIAFNPDSAASVTIVNQVAAQLSRAGAQAIVLLQSAPDPTQPRPSQRVPQSIEEGSAALARYDRKNSAATKIGEVEGGGEIQISEEFATADLRCVVSGVSLNPFWGYSGGPSSIIPGLASENTVKTCLSPTLRAARLPGVLTGNPTYEAILRASRTVSIDSAIHVVEKHDGEIAGTFVGDFHKTFEDACALAAKIFRPSLRRKADIVVASAGGIPWDRTLFDASSGALMAGTICKDHGILILVAECSEGLGVLSRMQLEIRESKKHTVSRRTFTLERMVQNSFQKACTERRAYLVSTLPEHHATTYGLLSAKSVGSALQRALRHVEKDASVAIIPYGSLTAPLVEQKTEHTD